MIGHHRLRAAAGSVGGAVVGFYDEFNNAGAQVDLTSARTPDQYGSASYQDRGIYDGQTAAYDTAALLYLPAGGDRATSAANTGNGLLLSELPTDFFIEAEFSLPGTVPYVAVAIGGTALTGFGNYTWYSRYNRDGHRENSTLLGGNTVGVTYAPLLRIEYNPSANQPRFYRNGTLRYTRANPVALTGNWCKFCCDSGASILYWKVGAL